MPVSGFENCPVKLLLGMIALVALVVACGSESTTDTSDSAIAPIEVAELLDGSSPTDASVIGFVVIDDGGSRLCEALAESFPPQCGGSAVVIANPDVLTVALEQEQSVQWTNERVRLDGTYDGAQFTLVE
jgi:hypothetical protein